MDISDELDRSFGDGPPMPPPSDLLPSAHRALARRRAVLGTLAGAAGVALTVSLVAVASGEPATVAPADGPPAAATDAPTPAPSTPQDPTTEPSPDGPLAGVPDKGLVTFGEGSTLVPAQEGVEILRQVDHPRLGTAWALPRDRSAAAEVVADGTRWFVIVRSDGGPAQDISVRAGEGGHETLREFLAQARKQYQEGGGGLL